MSYLRELRGQTLYFAPEEKAAHERNEARKAAIRNSPDYDEEQFLIEESEQAEEYRRSNKLEFFGYTPLDRRIDDLTDAVKALTHLKRLELTPKDADAPEFRPKQRPGMPILPPGASDEVIDLDAGGSLEDLSI